MANSKGGSSKLLWLMVVLVLLSTVAAGAAIYMVMSDQESSAADLQTQQLERQTPIFLKIEPFTVNLADDKFGSRLLYAGLTLKVGNEETQATLDESMPEVRSRLLMLFSGKRTEDITSPQGKRQLAKEVVAVLSSDPMTEPQPPLDIQDVLFTEFIVQ